MTETISASLHKGKGKVQPLYKQVEVLLKDQIHQGAFKHGERLPSASKLVGQLQVDYVTINSAFRNLEKDGYIKCESGRGKGPLVVKATKVKQNLLFVRWDYKRQSMSLTEGIRRFADENGHDCTICYAQQKHETAIDCIANPRNGIDGIIVMPHDLPEYRTAVLKAIENGIKVVFVDRSLDNIPVSSVSMDHIAAAYQITNHLLTHSLPVHYFGFVQFPSSCRDRLKGWSMAMSEHGYTDQQDYIWDLSKEPDIMNADAESEQEQLERIKRAAHRFFDARKTSDKFSILCHADGVAQGVYLAAEEMGMQIGKDVLLAGFGNLPLCERLGVKLTSVSQPDEEVGYEAAKILNEELMQENLQHRIHLLPAQICIRESSGG